MSAFAVRAAAAVLGCLGLATVTPRAQALSFVFNDASNGSLTAEQLGALQQAGAFWSSKLNDPVTVVINVSFASLGSNVLGNTLTSEVAVPYSTLRANLISDKKTALDTTAVGSLAAGSGISFLATQGDKSSLLDNNGSTNNNSFYLTTANARAIGINVGGGGNPDATMQFSSDFAFAYSRVGGIPSNKVDFIAVAEHEIGHALGFVSGVDFVDGCLDTPLSCGLSGANNEFDGHTVFTSLDLFRYSASGTRDLRVGGSPYFSVDGGATSLQSFSTGENHGNGWQASHFGPGTPTLMKPALSFGQIQDGSALDIAAFDAIGWDAVAAVPEPATWALWLGGLAAVGCLARRRMR